MPEEAGHPWRPTGDTQAILDAIRIVSDKFDLFYTRMSAQLGKVSTTEIRIMASLADIQAAVAAEQTVEASVVTLLGQLSADLQAALASNDPTAMQAVVDQLNQNAQSLAAAVTANTPAAPATGPSGPTGPTGP
jgi:hypothetical protein